MKKKLMWIITLVMALMLSTVAIACDEGEKDPPPPSVYTVTLPTELTGGSVTASASEVTEGEKLTLTVAVDDGYVLSFVKINGETITLDNGTYEFTPTASVNVTAEILAIVYQITYETEGGVLPDGTKTTYTVKDGEIELPTPTRAGSTFAGWYNADYSQSFTKIASNSKGDLKFYAAWSLDEYVITYDLSQAPSGVTNPNLDVTYNVDDNIVLQPMADTAEKKFIGWEFENGDEAIAIGNGMLGPITVTAIYEDRGINMDGAIDSSWSNYPNAVVTASGQGTTITAYERIIGDGLFIELKIEHTNGIVGGNSPNEWWNDSYVAAFIVGQDTTRYQYKENVTPLELLAAAHQYQLAEEHNRNWDYFNMTTTGDATSGYVTVIELYEELADIIGFSEGDDYIRVGMGLAWFNGNKNEVRVVRGQYGKNGTSTEQKYYENGYYVTEDGAFALDPTKYHVVLSYGANGTVTADKIELETENTEEVTLTIAPAVGYALDELTVDGVDVTSEVSSGEYKFTPSKYLTEVVAAWNAINYLIEYENIPSGVTNVNELKTSYTVESVVTFEDLDDTETQVFIGWKYNDEWITSTEGLANNLVISAVYEDIITVSASGTIKSASYMVDSTAYSLDDSFDGTVTALCTDSVYTVIEGKTYQGTIASNGSVTFASELPLGTYTVKINATDYHEASVMLTVEENGANSFEATVANRMLTKGTFANGAYSVSRTFALSSANEKYTESTFIEATLNFNGDLKLQYECSGGIVATGTGTIGHGTGADKFGFNVYLINTDYASNPTAAPNAIRIGRHNYAAVTADVPLAAEDINGDGSVTLTVVRYNGLWYVFANGNFKHVFNGDALLGDTSWQVGIQGEARDITATNLAISGNAELVEAYVKANTDVALNGKKDDIGWTDAMKQTIVATDNNTIDVYARLTDAGLYSEIVISHTSYVNGQAEWYNNSYLAAFIAGARYTGEQSIQHQITESIISIGDSSVTTVKFNHKDNGDGTHTTVIEIFKPFAEINGYAAGDKYVRMSMGFARWDGNSTEHRLSTGYASTIEQKYYENGYYITKDGIFSLNPDEAVLDGKIDASIWSGYTSGKAPLGKTTFSTCNNVEVYGRLISNGLFIEMRIEHSSDYLTGNAPDSWWLDSYIAVFVEGAGYTTPETVAASYQHRLTASIIDGKNYSTAWSYAAMKMIDDTDGAKVTVVEMFKPFNKITDYVQGQYVRVGISLGCFNGSTSGSDYLTHNNLIHTGLSNQHYVTADGMFATAPTAQA